MAAREPSAWSGFNRGGTSSSYFGSQGNQDYPPLSSNFNVKPDWIASGSGVDWNKSLNVDLSGIWDKSYGKYNDPEESYLNKAKSNLFGIARKKRDEDESAFGRSSGFGIGRGMEGSAGQVLPDLGVVYPQQHAPMFIPGQEGKRSGIFGQAGGLAGALGSAFGIFGPLGAPIGAAVGGLIDTARG